MKAEGKGGTCVPLTAESDHLQENHELNIISFSLENPGTQASNCC